MPIVESESSTSFRACSTGIRVVSWLLAIIALFSIVVYYPSLPDDLPVSRWHSSPKSWLLAVRVPLINLLSLGLVELLGLSLSRYDGDSKTKWVASVLFVTAGSKALIEGIEIVSLPLSHTMFFVLLIVVVLTGIAVAVWCGNGILRNDNWKKLTMTSTEQIVSAVLIAAIIALNLPLILGKSFGT